MMTCVVVTSSIRQSCYAVSFPSAHTWVYILHGGDSRTHRRFCARVCIKLADKTKHVERERLIAQRLCGYRRGAPMLPLTIIHIFVPLVLFNRTSIGVQRGLD